MKFITGFYKVQNKAKYRGNKDNIVYRSGWERRAFLFFDNSPYIKEWSSEELIIPYFGVDGKIHRYFPDVTFTNQKGERFVVEIKPKKQTKKPRKSKSEKKYLTESLTYVTNQLKWEAAIKFCLERKSFFLILTEDQINPIFSDKKILENLEMKINETKLSK